MYYRLRSNICLLFCLMCKCICVCICVYLYVPVFVVAVLGVGWVLISLLQHPVAGLFSSLCTDDKHSPKRV